MLDIKFLRENIDKVKQSLRDRKNSMDIDEVIALDTERRKLLGEVEKMKHEKKLASQEIGKLIAQKQDVSKNKQQIGAISLNIDAIDTKVDLVSAKMRLLLLSIPNIPHDSVPIGPEATANKLIREWGDIPALDFPARPHTELCEMLDIIDFKRSAKISGSAFILYKGLGARLERALINFMLDLHTREHGYTEIFPPFLVNRASMTATGQLPKMEEDLYKLKDDDLFLIPTAEVPVTNMHRDEVLSDEELPKCYTAYTACFRREAGSYGKDTKGLMRVHQFDKVELVKFVKPERSYDELELLLNNAERVLQLLEVPYRVMALSTEGISFAAAKCYDIEVKAIGSNMYLETSSVSNFEDFQARRANIKYKDKETGKTEYVHTLNGSGVATARLLAAIIENNQTKKGSISIPQALRPYMDGLREIK